VAKGLTSELVGVLSPDGIRSNGLLCRLAMRFGVDAPKSIGEIDAFAFRASTAGAEKDG